MPQRAWPWAVIVATALMPMSSAYATSGNMEKNAIPLLPNAPATHIAQLPALSNTSPAPMTQVSVLHVNDNWLSDYFVHWFERVDAAQASQPHWVTPLATVTPRLEEEVRYDQFWQHQATGAWIHSFDGGKGLELIPTTTNEVILNAPAYQERGKIKPANGFADVPFLLLKQRLFSANAANGDYIVTAFLGVTAPTGGAAFTNNAWIITPTLAAGKGFGKIDVQGTFGAALPISHDDVIGKAITPNVAFQYHVTEYLWPELEVNDIYWSGGQRDGKNQILLTPGVVVGRFHFGGRLKGNCGVGYQFAVSPILTRKPVLTPTYDHAWVLTARLSF